MSKLSPAVKRHLSRVLAEYRSVVEKHADLLEHQPKLAIRIVFRMETAKFFIDQLDFWHETGDMEKLEETANRARKSLEDVYQLITELSEYDRDEDVSKE